MTIAIARTPSMLSEDTANCLALTNTAILRLIEELIERGVVVATPSALLQNAVSDLQARPKRSSRVEANRLIRKESMPRLSGAPAS
jgi:hypothetical protein